MRQVIGLILSLILLAGCGEGSVVFAPTPLPPDVSPLPYTHPSGAFTLDVPRTWTVYEQSLNNIISTDFTPPGYTTPALSITAARLDAPIETTDLLNRYQTEIRPDARRYRETDRQAMGDGSWRLTGIGQTLGGQSREVNTFIQRDGDVIAIIETLIPDNATLLRELETAINTFSMNPNLIIVPVRLSALSNRSNADVRVMNLHAWTTTLGIYFVTGEVANFSDAVIGDIPVRIGLQRADGSILVDAIDDVMGYGLPPGEFAPFSLRFGEGKPPEALRYTVNIGNTSWDPTQALERPLASQEQLQWADSWRLSPEGHFIIEGTVTNISTTPVDDPMVIVTIFDINQNVIAAAFSPLEVTTLQPEESTSYLLRIQELGGQPTDYITNVQGWLQSE